MYSIQGTYKCIEMFGDTDSLVSEDILTLINNEDLENPSDDFKLKLSKINQTELNNLFTENQIDYDKLVPLINILDESQIKSIVNILNQEQLETILILSNNIMIPLENINKEQFISIADKDAITKLIMGLIGMKISLGRETPNLKYITIPQFNLLIDNDFISFINEYQNMYYFLYLIKELSKVPDLILINHIINLLMVIDSDTFIKITDPLHMFNIIYYLLSKHSSLVNNKFDHLLLSITPEQIKLLDLSIIDDIYDSPIMNKFSSISQDIIKSLTIKLIPAIELPNSSIIWTIVKRNKYNCIATNGTGQYLTACADNLIYSSSDYGKTWLEYEYPKTTIVNMLSNDKFLSIASDNTGKYLVASAERRIYLSSDFGVSWNLSSTPLTNIMWTSVTSDSTGKYLAACASPAFIDNIETDSDEGVYTSQDFGITWKLTSIPPDIQILSIQSNITGKYLFVCTNTSLSYLSNDYGNIWTEILSPKKGFSITSAAINFDASLIIGVIDSNGLYLYSYSSWENILTDFQFNSVSLDTSGKYIVAGGLNGIYESSDFGLNWTLSNNTENKLILSNYIGNQIIATDDNGIYIGNKKVLPTISTTTIPTISATISATTIPTISATTIPKASPTISATISATTIPTILATTIPKVSPTISATTIPKVTSTTSITTIPFVTSAPQLSDFFSGNNMIIIISVIFIIIVIVILYNNPSILDSIYKK